MTQNGSLRRTVRSEAVAWREVGEEIVVLHLTTATYLSVNGTGRLLWLALVDGASPSELADLLAGEYDIDPSLAERDVKDFLDNLEGLDLLVSAEG